MNIRRLIHSLLVEVLLRIALLAWMYVQMRN